MPFPHKCIYLIRHGESEQNVIIKSSDGKYDTPDHATPLTTLGHKQAYQAGIELKKHIEYAEDPVTTKLYCSPYRRTRETRDEILKTVHVKQAKEDDMLVELQFGLFDGLSKQDIPEIFPKEWKNYQHNRQHSGKFFARRPNGESPLDCAIRQRIFLEKLYRDFENPCIRNIIIIGHGAQLTCFKKEILNCSHEWYEEQGNPTNCSIQLLNKTPFGVVDKGFLYGGME